MLCKQNFSPPSPIDKLKEKRFSTHVSFTSTFFGCFLYEEWTYRQPFYILASFIFNFRLHWDTICPVWKKQTFWSGQDHNQLGKTGISKWWVVGQEWLLLCLVDCTYKCFFGFHLLIKPLDKFQKILPLKCESKRVESRFCFTPFYSHFFQRKTTHLSIISFNFITF